MTCLVGGAASSNPLRPPPTLESFALLWIGDGERFSILENDFQSA
jgi:hypothetical protein